MTTPPRPRGRPKKGTPKQPPPPRPKRETSNSVKRDADGRLAKGTKRVPGSGKKRFDGSLLRMKIGEVCERLECDPIQVLAHMANGESDLLGVRLTARDIRDAATELAAYLHPKRKPMSDPAEPSEQRAAAREDTEIEIKREQLRALRMQRQEEERRINQGTTTYLENRPLPMLGTPGRGPCGLYHACLDPSMYPTGPMVVVPPSPALHCPVCGKPPFPFPADEGTGT